MNFNDFLHNNSIFSHREESELVTAKKKIKDFFLKNILEINLSKREKEIYTMKYKKNLTHTEIANKLKISRKTSRNILCKANQKINKITNNFKENNERTT